MQTVDTRTFIDCPDAGAQDVTDTLRCPRELVSADEAMTALGLDWRAFVRLVTYGNDERYAQRSYYVIRCDGCGEIVRVLHHGTPTATVVGKSHNRRRIDVKVGPAARRGRCSGVCLNGKTSCDCKCNGRCHGAGRCQCGEVA